MATEIFTRFEQYPGAECSRHEAGMPRWGRHRYTPERAELQKTAAILVTVERWTLLGRPACERKLMSLQKLAPPHGDRGAPDSTWLRRRGLTSRRTRVTGAFMCGESRPEKVLKKLNETPPMRAANRTGADHRDAGAWLSLSAALTHWRSPCRRLCTWPGRIFRCA